MHLSNTSQKPFLLAFAVFLAYAASLDVALAFSISHQTWRHRPIRDVILAAAAQRDVVDSNNSSDGKGRSLSQKLSFENAKSRRDMLHSAVTAGIFGTASTGSSLESAAATSTTTTFVADLPMIRLKLPANGLGKDYIATQICLPGADTAMEFMIDSGLTLEIITPHLQNQLGLRSVRTGLQGLTAGGVPNNEGSDIVDIVGASLCSGMPDDTRASAATFPLPTLHAIVADFPQEHMDPKHDPVEGMLGLELLSQFDVDFDFEAGRVRLYQAGTAVNNAVNKEKANFVEIPAVVINDTGLLGIRITTSTSNQPVLGLLDCGSSFTVINWKAAELLNMPRKNDPAYNQGPKISAVGVDGRTFALPTLKQTLSFRGEAQKDAKSGLLTGFAGPPSFWKPWDPVLLAVGDLPVFPDLLGDGVRQYTGPAALIGLDVLSQRRFILESAGANIAKTKKRRLFVSSA